MQTFIKACENYSFTNKISFIQFYQKLEELACSSKYYIIKKFQFTVSVKSYNISLNVSFSEGPKYLLSGK